MFKTDLFKFLIVFLFLSNAVQADVKEDILADVESSFKELSERSKTAKEMYEFYKKNRILGKITTLNGKPAVEVLTKPTTEDWFVVTIAKDDEEYEKFAPHNTIAAALNGVIFLRNHKGTRLIRALYIIHELDHVRAHQESRKKGMKVPDILLEVRAFEVQRQILNEVTYWKYDKALLAQFNEGKWRIDAAVREGRSVIEWWIDADRISSALELPRPQSDYEKEARVSLYKVHVMFIWTEMQTGDIRQKKQKYLFGMLLNK